MATTTPNDAFSSPMEKYVQYNFQRPDSLHDALTLLRGEAQDPRRVIVLSGERGIGRHYFLESVAYLATQQGVRTRVATIDLDGYADEGLSVEDYANHLLRTYGESEKSRIAVTVPLP